MLDEVARYEDAVRMERLIKGVVVYGEYDKAHRALFPNQYCPDCRQHWGRHMTLPCTNLKTVHDAPHVAVRTRGRIAAFLLTGGKEWREWRRTKEYLRDL